MSKLKITSADHERMLLINNEFEEAVRSQIHNIRRSENNWRHYFAVYDGQHKFRDLEQLHNENRQAEFFNIIEPKVDTLAGALSSEEFDVDYKPIEGPRNSLTEAVTGSWYSDKDLCHYEKQIANVIKNGLVYRGDLKMMRSRRYNPLRNIAFKEVQPGYLLRDPYWDTDDDRDCMKAWEIYYMDAVQLQQTFKAKGPAVESAAMHLKKMGGEYRNFMWDKNLADAALQGVSGSYRGIRGHLFKVIEYHWMEIINTKRIMGLKMGDNSQRWINFPITNDDAAREAYMIQNDIDPNTMMITPYEDRIHHTEIICPELNGDGMLEGGISKIQPKRLPYFHFSANRAGGLDKGIVDNLIDLQENINSGEMKIKNSINTAGGGGKLASNEVWDTTDKQSKFKENMSDPSYVEFCDPDDIKDAIGYIDQNVYHPEIFRQIERMYDVVDRISKVPAAMDAMSENSGESGVLFDRKLQVSRMGLITLISRLKEFRKNIAEAYYEQWQLEYNGPERMMSSFDNKYNVTLNKRVYSPSDGKIYIQNRPAMVPRCNVIVTESPASPTRKMRDRALNADMLDRAMQVNPEMAGVFFRGLVKTLDQDDDLKAKTEAFMLMMDVRDRKRIETEISTLEATDKQAVLAKVQALMGIDQLTGGQQQEMDPVQIAEADIPQPPQQQTPPPQAPEQVPEEFSLTS